MEASPPTEKNQLERFGMILYLIFDMPYKSYNPFTPNVLKFIIHLCMKHTHIDHFIRYTIGIIIKMLKEYRENKLDANPILYDTYFFLIFLTKYHQEKKENDVCWSSYIVYAWCIFLDVFPNMCEMFYEDRDLVVIFTNILQYEAKKYFITFQSDGSFRTNEYLYENDFCFDIVYDFLLLRTNIYFQTKLSEYYPFILTENKQLQNRKVIRNILCELIEARKYTKSANKK
jgi:hypothetical protein